MRRDHDIELMQHADGELSERARADVARRLESDDVARTKVEAIGEVGGLVRGHLELSADAVLDARFARMWREIDTGIEAAVPRGGWARITSWLERHRGHLVTGAVSAGAVAALALVVRPGTDDRQVSSTRSIEVLPAAMRTAPVVDSLDTPDGTGTVMNFEDEDGHTTVIWVTPDDTVEGI
ncbi:MAG: hypothetical protein H0X17_19720 [Deltaproteobacteria bacterium]|nr:hypothetical protein [Deltaproteobacteria bacterium]